MAHQPSNVKSETMLWQQNSYLSPDSGIQTGIVTQAPSVIGNDDDMEKDQILFDLDQGFQQGFTQDQVDGSFRTIFHNLGVVITRLIMKYCIRNEPAVESDS